MNNKFLLSTFYFLFSIFYVLPFFVFAISAGEILTPKDVTPQDVGYVKVGMVEVSGIDELAGYLDKLLKWVFGIFLAIAVVFIVSAGYVFMFGAGDEEKIRNARKRIVWAMAAIAVALLAGSVVLLISNFLGVGGGQQGTDKLNPYPGGPYQTQNQYYQQTSHTCSQNDINSNWCCAGSSNAASDCCGGKKAGDTIICFR